jgi:hypothetical protein
MGVLALLTRETPAAIAAERKPLRSVLESSASQANAVEKRMEQYAARLESRLTQLLRNWKRAWTHHGLQSCWAKVCGSLFRDQVYRLRAQLFLNPALN